MINMTLSQLAKLLSLPQPEKGDLNFNGLCIDSRRLEPGNLFIALPGERVDGHDYLDEAKRKGAAAALVSRQTACDLPQLVVKDMVLAMGKMGAAWRDRFPIPFIAVTGSNGKTTLKNMIASILKAACLGNESQVLATVGTLNNHLGLPLTLARLNNTHRYAVIEMGMNHFGEIEYLTRLTKPNVTVITNAAASHLEGVGDLAGVARAKGEIFVGLSREGTAVLNKDDHFFNYWREQVGQRRMLSFGFDNTADIQATLKESHETQLIALHTPKGNIDIQLPLLGKHNILNAMAAAAATIAVGVDLAAIKTGIESMVPAPGRMQRHTIKNVTIIDDTYNANPFSLQAAIDTLATIPGNKVLVLGDMKELGHDATQLHHTAGKHIRAAGIQHLLTLGELSQHTSQAFGEGAKHYHTYDQLIADLTPLLNNPATVLVKGSRSMRMETIVKHFIEPNQ